MPIRSNIINAFGKPHNTLKLFLSENSCSAYAVLIPQPTKVANGQLRETSVERETLPEQADGENHEYAVQGISDKILSG